MGNACAGVAQRGKYQSWREEARNRDADLQNALTEHGVTLRQGVWVEMLEDALTWLGKRKDWDRFLFKFPPPNKRIQPCFPGWKSTHCRR